MFLFVTGMKFAYITGIVSESERDKKQVGVGSVSCMTNADYAVVDFI
jgi:hypothetical protein